jgi:phage shock protein PspC (stress-responsive transcriptional regulator)
MKQVININYHGRIIPIEIAAHDLLKTYTADLQKHFENEEGKEEIINDIEGRISELFQEQLTKGAVCITEQDVQVIIKNMGTPEDFEAEPTINHESKSETKENNFPGAKKRLFRDENNKVIGGVCSGLANYFNMDVVVVRVIFLLMFFSVGFGLIPYLILWFAVPSSATKSIGSVRKKLYRDTDEKMIAGVCSGLANYFGIKVWIVRALFLLPVLIMIFEWNHFFFNVSPSSFIIYIIFWLVMPEAKTTSEKLEMKGKKIDVDSIKQSIHEEMNDLKDRAKSLGKEAAAVAGEKSKMIASDSGNALQKLISGVVKVITFIVKAFVYTILTIIGLAMFLVLFAIGVTSFSLFPLKDFLVSGIWQNAFAWGTLIFFIVVPIIGILTWAIRRIGKIKRNSIALRATFISLWIVGWVALMGLVVTLGKDFKSVNNSFEENVKMDSVNINKLLVGFYKQRQNNNTKTIRFGDFINVDEDTLYIDNVGLKIKQSTNDSFQVTVKKMVNGSTRFAADTSASIMHYNILQKDSFLLIDKSVGINKREKFRNQNVVVTIYVPIGKQIQLPYSKEIVVKKNSEMKLQFWDESNVESRDYIMRVDGLYTLDGKASYDWE